MEYIRFLHIILMLVVPISYYSYYLRHIYANPAMNQFTGVKDIIGQRSSTWVKPDLMEFWNKVISHITNTFTINLSIHRWSFPFSPEIPRIWNSPETHLFWNLWDLPFFPNGPNMVLVLYPSYLGKPICLSGSEYNRLQEIGEGFKEESRRIRIDCTRKNPTVAGCVGSKIKVPCHYVPR